MLTGPLQRARGFVQRRRGLFAALALTFFVGILVGMFTPGDTDHTSSEQIRKRVETLWTPAPAETTSAGVSHTSAPQFAAVWRVALTGRGGVLYVVGGCILLGLSLVGAPLAFAVVFWRGFALGFAAGLLLQVYAWRGAVLAAAALAPHNLAGVPALILASAGTLGFSRQAVNVMFGRPGMTMRSPALRTFLLWGVSAIMIVVGTVIEAYVTPPLVLWTAGQLFGE